MSPIKKIVKRGHIYHVYYRRLGAYRFIGQNSLRLLIAMIILGAAVYLFNRYVLDVSAATAYITEHYNKPIVLGTFLLSESTLGLLAPELYITWVSSLDFKWLWLLLLAMISYGGGVGAYFIGTRLYLMPRIHSWVDVKFAKQFAQIKKFGGLLIVVAALTPLPFSPICIISGIIKFPLNRFLLLTLTRFARFAIYGSLIFGLL
jgi:membrane protein YqaA with SNARE-associated domain